MSIICKFIDEIVNLILFQETYFYKDIYIELKKMILTYKEEKVFVVLI